MLILNGPSGVFINRPSIPIKARWASLISISVVR